MVNQKNAKKKNQKGKNEKKSTNDDDDDDDHDDDDVSSSILLQAAIPDTMVLAKAILTNDTITVGKILTESLPINKKQQKKNTNHSSDNNNNNLVQNNNKKVVENVVVTKSLGEAFTGGRSTPVYHITCSVVSVGHHPKQQQQQQRQRHFVVKLVLMTSSTTTTEEDEERRLYQQQKRESYAVERRFYDCVAPRINNNNNNNQLVIPKLFYSDNDGSRPWPATCFLMNDLRQAGFPCHPEFLNIHQAKRALRWIASFHALFWGEQHNNNNNNNNNWKKDLWSRGGFWTPKIDRNGTVLSSIKTAGIARQWTQTVRWLEQQSNKKPSISSASVATAKGLGKRLESAAGPIAEFLASESSSSSNNSNNKSSRIVGTLIHGDYKAANLFLSSTTTNTTMTISSSSSNNNNSSDDGNGDGDDDQHLGGGGAESVAVLDFQYTGWGLGAEDVAYILFPDARGHYLDDDDDNDNNNNQEKQLLQCYHEELINQLILQQRGGPSTLSFENFRAHYELSRIDFLRYLLGRGWVASNEGDIKLIAAIENTMNELDGGKVLANPTDYIQAISRFCGN